MPALITIELNTWGRPYADLWGSVSVQLSPPRSSVLQTRGALSSSDSQLHLLNSEVHQASPPKLSRQQAGATRELRSFIPHLSGIATSCCLILCVLKPLFHLFCPFFGWLRWSSISDPYYPMLVRSGSLYSFIYNAIIDILGFKYTSNYWHTWVLCTWSMFLFLSFTIYFWMNSFLLFHFFTLWA